MEVWLAELRAEFCGGNAATGQFRRDGNNQRRVRIPDIGSGALPIATPGEFVQLVALRNNTVLCLPAIRAPTTMDYVMLDGPVECGPISPCLAARNDFFNRYLDPLSLSATLWQ